MRYRTSFQQLLRACQLFPRYGGVNLLVGSVKRRVRTAGESPRFLAASGAATGKGTGRVGSGSTGVAEDLRCWTNTVPLIHVSFGLCPDGNVFTPIPRRNLAPGCRSREPKSYAPAKKREQPVLVAPRAGPRPGERLTDQVADCVWSRRSCCYSKGAEIGKTQGSIERSATMHAFEV